MPQAKQICVATVLAMLLSFPAGVVESAPGRIGQQEREESAQVAAKASSSSGPDILGESSYRANALTGIEIDEAQAEFLIVMNLVRQWKHQERNLRIAEAYLVEAEKSISEELNVQKRICAESIGVAMDLLREVKVDLLSSQFASANADTVATKEATQERVSADLAVHEPVIKKAQSSMRARVSAYEASRRQILADLATRREMVERRQDSNRLVLAAIFDTGSNRVKALEELSSIENGATASDQAYIDALLKTRDKNARMQLEQMRSLPSALATSRDAIERLHGQSLSRNRYASNTADHVSIDERLERFDDALSSRRGRVTEASSSVAGRLDALTTSMAQVSERETSLETNPITHVAALTELSSETAIPVPPAARSAQPALGSTTPVPVLQSNLEELVLAERDGVMVVAQNQNTIADALSGQQISIPAALPIRASSNLMNEEHPDAEDSLRNSANLNSKSISLDGMVSPPTARTLARNPESDEGVIELSPIGVDGNLTLNAESVDITAILRLLSECGKLNIIAGPGVSGDVTISLHDVSFDEALDGILGVAGLTRHQVGSIMYVVHASAKADLPPAANDFAIKTFKINHADPQELLNTILQFTSLSGKALLSPGRVLVIHDSPYHLRLIGDLIKRIDVPPSQVLIETLIVNVSLNKNTDLGVGFDTMPFTMFGIEAVGSGFARNFATVTPDATGLFAGTLQTDSQIFMEALERKGDTTILAAPQVLALDGEQARIQIGDRLGFTITTTTQTSSLESVEFLDVGTVLAVTPQIGDDGLIRLQINPKVSTGVIDAEGLPSESTREVTTTMLVEDGNTVVVGGLLSATKAKSHARIPVLGSIPVLGALFGRSTWRDDKSEVLVLLTTHIVGPTPSPYMQRKIEEVQRQWGQLQEMDLLEQEEKITWKEKRAKRHEAKSDESIIQTP